VTTINSKLGLKAAGARARMNSLSGVRCPNCPHVDVVSNRVSGRLVWMCGWCGNIWAPTASDVASYNARVRERDRISA